MKFLIFAIFISWGYANDFYKKEDGLKIFSLNNKTDALRALGDPDKWKLVQTESMDYYLFCSRDQRQVLKAEISEGRLMGEFSKVEVHISDPSECKKAFVLSEYDEFETKSGIKLGMLRDEALKLWRQKGGEAQKIQDNLNEFSFWVDGPEFKGQKLIYTLKFSDEKVSLFSINFEKP